MSDRCFKHTTNDIGFYVVYDGQGCPDGQDCPVCNLEAENAQLKKENEQMKHDLAVVHEHTNLAESNTKKTFVRTNRMIRCRTKKYADLQLTAGPLYTKG